jgi:glutathione S-transferase
MPEKLTLYVCDLNRTAPKVHPCRRAHDALEAAGLPYETVVFDAHRWFGLFTSGKRPKLKAISGQEKLPVLGLPDGTTVNGSGDIIAWAKSNAPAG